MSLTRLMTVEVLSEPDENGLQELYIEYRCMQYGHLKKATVRKNLAVFVQQQKEKGYEVEVIT